MSNKAAYITGPKAKPLQIKDAPLPKAGKGEVVVKNAAAAVNPVDWKIQDEDFFIKSYPNVLGTDVAGEVYEVGEGVTHVKKGDRVLAHAFSLVDSDPEQGGFQLYTKTNAILVAKIPDSMKFIDATVLPLAISTAAACLYKKEALGLPMPTTSDLNPPSTGKSVLIWGGSSSIGATAIQLAVGSGIKAVTVASKRNFDKVKALGAAAVFDYNSPTVIDDIVGALEGTDFAGICDCIGTPDAARAWSPVYKKLGGRYGTVLFDDSGLPEGIKGTSIFAANIALADKYVGEGVWANWVPGALQKGTLKPLPPPIVIEGGLEATQEALEAQKKGVSFGKIVIEL